VCEIPSRSALHQVDAADAAKGELTMIRQRDHFFNEEERSRDVRWLSLRSFSAVWPHYCPSPQPLMRKAHRTHKRYSLRRGPATSCWQRCLRRYCRSLPRRPRLMSKKVKNRSLLSSTTVTTICAWWACSSHSGPTTFLRIRDDCACSCNARRELRGRTEGAGQVVLSPVGHTQQLSSCVFDVPPEFWTVNATQWVGALMLRVPVTDSNED
jgi:hypothetical protein